MTARAQQEETAMTVLITGAAGRHGATGNHAARQLLARGLPVRAFVRHDDDRAAELEALGADVVVGDLHDFDAVRAALEGVTAAYFTYPLAEGLLEATTTFAAAGKQAGLRSVVNMSQITAGPSHSSPAARRHWLAERVLDWSGIAVTHLRPPFFLENLITIASAATVRAEARIYLPYGNGRHAPVAGQDVARVVAAVLADPAAHQGRTYVPTGPASLSMAEQAAVFSHELGRPVQYVDIPVERWRQLLSQVDGVSAYLIEHLARVAEAHQRGEQDTVTDVVETIGGAPPKSVATFIRENRAVVER
jgi:NAD(P)H dehydrogenase (quinone)